MPSLGSKFRKNPVKKGPVIDEVQVNLDYHSLSLEELATRFETSLTDGLTTFRARQLLNTHGKNLIESKKPNKFKKILGYMFSGFSPMLWIGTVICILAYQPIGDPPQAINLGLGFLLLVIIILQAIFAAFQDWSSTKVMKGIKNMMPSQATVIRDGVEVKISTNEVVPGDLVLLSYGSKVPCDVRIIETHDLKFDKSMLTGESEPIDGTVDKTDDLYVESKNIGYMSTLITNGQGRGICVGTGRNTMIGKIASLTNDTGKKKTRLEKEIVRFVIFISILAVSTVIILFILWGAWLYPKYPKFINLATMLVNVIGVMVAYIPTGLPVAVSLSLLLMARRMARHRVLVKNLSTIETLSTVNVIASDKTGTLTQNKMFVANYACNLESFNLITAQSNSEQKESSAFKQLVAVANLCNNARFTVETGDTKKNRRMSRRASRRPSMVQNQVINLREADGDATDIALLKFSAQHLEDSNGDKLIEDSYTELLQIPFNSRNKWMLKIHRIDDVPSHNLLFGDNIKSSDSYVNQNETTSLPAYDGSRPASQALEESEKPSDTEDHSNIKSLFMLKGAPDRLLPKCKYIVSDAKGTKNPQQKNSMTQVVITPAHREIIQKKLDNWCNLGQRVLLLSMKRQTESQTTDLLSKSQTDIEAYVNSEACDDMCLVGLVGIIDPPREGIADVIETCRGAGIRVIMITGDYALTAAAIAHDIGIFHARRYDTVADLKQKADEERAERQKNKTDEEPKKDSFFAKLMKRFKKKPDEKSLVRPNSSLLMSGADLNTLEDDDWRELTKYEEIVCARITPEQKLKIVKEFQGDGYIVGVTGDGVNDAPALKCADIGIAMGSGSEVAAEAAQLVLLDSNFEAILVAIENGRLVFQNLRKVILYLLPAGSIGEIFPILVNMIFGVPLPLSPFLMIIICVVTDMSPALSLMLEKPERDLLKDPPRPKNKHLVDAKVILQAYFFLGFFEGFFSHVMFFLYMGWYGNFSPADLFFCYGDWQDGYHGYTQDQLNTFNYKGQTVTFITLVWMQIFGNIFATRTNYKSLSQWSPAAKKSRNLFLFGAVGISLTLALLVVFLPFINDLFQTSPVPSQFFFLPLIFAFLLLTLDELRKLAVRKQFWFFHKVAW